MADKLQRILDFRNRPPLPPYAPIFDLKRNLLAHGLKRMALEAWFHWLTKSIRPARNPGAATMTPSMQMVGEPEAMEQWWHEIDAAGIDAVVSVGRLSEDRGNIDAATLSKLQQQYPHRFYGLAPVNLEQDAAATVADCEHAVRDLGLRGINIEPGIRKRGGPCHVDNPDLYPIYEAMVGLDVPVMVYTSPFAGPNPYFANDMAPYERVMQRFPRVTLVLGHGGYPRVRQVLDTAARYRNLYICQDIYTFWPAGHLYRDAIERLQDQFVFGTSYPFSSTAEPVSETLKLPLSPAAMQKYLWGNGRRLLGLSP
jgi:predicted TIM-barrel fold metal-dependent hydrolase